METSVIRRTDISGSTFIVNVSALQLSTDLSVKDFLATHNGVDVTNLYTKTNSEQLTYTGSNVTLGTRVELYRATPLSFTETSFLGTTTALELTNALGKLKRRVDELEARTAWQTSLIQQGGLTVGNVPIMNTPYGPTWDGDVSNAPSRDAVYDRVQTIVNDTPYGVSWNGDTTTAPSRNAVYDKLVLNDASIASLTATDSTIQSSVTSLTTTVNNNQTTADSRFSVRTHFGFAAASAGDFGLNVGWNNITNLTESFASTGFSLNTGTGDITIGKEGMYMLFAKANVNFSGGTPPDSVTIILSARLSWLGLLDGIRLTRLACLTGGGDEQTLSGCAFGYFSVGNTVGLSVFVITGGGSGFSRIARSAQFGLIKLDTL